MADRHLAALDIGTNSFHLIIANVEADGNFSVVDRKRVVLRLAAECWDGNKIINDDELKKSVETLLKFKKTSDLYNTEIKAVATSTIREASNRDYFIKNIFEQTGINIEIIDGSEEARIIFLGASKALDLKNKDVLCFDIGGGSTELILRISNRFVFSESLKLGAVRLSKMFFPDYIITPEGVEACIRHISEVFKNNKKLCFDCPALVNAGTSGTVQSAVLLSHSQTEKLSPYKLNGYDLGYEEFLVIFNEMMSRKTPADRKAMKGMEAKRADIIPAGLLILKSIFELFNLKSITYSEYALREGLIISQI